MGRWVGLEMLVFQTKMVKYRTYKSFTLVSRKNAFGLPLLERELELGMEP